MVLRGCSNRPLSNHCSKTFSHCGIVHNSKLTGDNYGNKFLHLVNSDDCGDSIFLDFDRKMGKEKRYETTIPRKLIDCCKTLSNGGIEVKVTVSIQPPLHSLHSQSK